MRGALSKVQIIFFHVIDENEPHDPITIPIQMNDSFESLGWLGVVLLQFLFVMRGLACMSPGPHYVNTMLLKIRFAFCVLCGILIFDVCTISLLLGQSFYVLFIPLIGFALLKMQVHYMLYLKVKYKDDGRELVTFADFITIQVCFPALNAWMTYQFFFMLFLTVSTICPPDIEDSKSYKFQKRFCPRYYEDNPVLAQDPNWKETVMYNWLYPYCCAAVIIIFMELSIFLAFYKDVIFSLVTLANYCGMMLETWYTVQ